MLMSQFPSPFPWSTTPQCNAPINLLRFTKIVKSIFMPPTNCDGSLKVLEAPVSMFVRLGASEHLPSSSEALQQIRTNENKCEHQICTKVDQQRRGGVVHNFDVHSSKCRLSFVNCMCCYQLSNTTTCRGNYLVDYRLPAREQLLLPLAATHIPHRLPNKHSAPRHQPIPRLFHPLIP